ncbi:MAG: phosphoribosylanthranilate isomerase [Nonlabens sp.]
MLIKVCGMRDPENIDALQQLDFDFMGVIRYPNSKRYVNDDQVAKLQSTTFNKGNVGVYVNATFENILKDIVPLQLDVIQLHGDEDFAFAKAILELDFKVFKAFQINENFDFSTLKEWADLGKQFQGKLFFLFDTASKNYGGSGKKFNWQQLENYRFQTPFFLSGGMQPEDVDRIKSFQHEMFMGVDLNSGFENEPAVKNIEQIETFIKAFRQ